MEQLIERKKNILLFLLFLLILGIISFPVIFGTLGTILPSMGYFLDVSDNFTLKYFLLTFQLPGIEKSIYCLLYTSPSPRDATLSRMPSSA